MAAERGVRIFTVGIGTTDGEILRTEGWSMRVRLDEESLKTIANITRGEYFYAGNALDLKKIYQSLNAKLVFETKRDRDHRDVQRRGGIVRRARRPAVAVVVQPHPVTASAARGTRRVRGLGVTSHAYPADVGVCTACMTSIITKNLRAVSLVEPR